MRRLSARPALSSLSSSPPPTVVVGIVVGVATFGIDCAAKGDGRQRRRGPFHHEREEDDAVDERATASIAGVGGQDRAHEKTEAVNIEKRSNALWLLARKVFVCLTRMVKLAELIKYSVCEAMDRW
jgi:hypothetical protein